MFDWLSTKIDNLWTALTAWISGIWTDFSNFMSDLPVNLLESVLNAVSSIFTSIPMPSFLTVGMGSMFNSLPSSVLYFLTESGFFQCLLIFGSGVAFRMLRKLLTLGQW